MTQSDRSRLTLPHEPFTLSVIKGALYLGAIACYLTLFISPWSLGSALSLGLMALFSVQSLEPKLSRRGVLTLGAASGLGGYLLSVMIDSWSGWGYLLSAPLMLRSSEAVLFGFLTFSSVFLLRVWGRRSRFGSAIEASVICYAVVQLFSTHRSGQVHEPRFFSDWVIINGQHSVQWWLTVFGVGLVAVALLVFSRVRRSLHLLWAAAIIALILGALYGFGNLGHKAKAIKPLTLGGGASKDKRDNKGGSGGGGDGNSDQNSPQNRPPTPVAVAVFHDDYNPEYGVLYFRQQTLSSFDGVKLVANSAKRFDQDVITQFPSEKGEQAALSQSVENHLQVSTSMYLIDEHPTPPALTHASVIKPLENPAPQRFVEAYSVNSLVPAVPLKRYVGRLSIPEEWSSEKRRYYLDTHFDDPRYQTLAEEIVRDLPSRLAADPIQRAIAIKRYLEREGYYTLKVKHRSSTDPAASFLFGDLRGYCVHFAHSAVHLLRSQGIAARVALGYAVDARTRSNSSAVLITGDRAHAWPEIHIDGVGWVTFDVYPEQSDEPEAQSVSQSLESLFGEMARKQLDRGLKRGSPFPWRDLGFGTLYLLCIIILLGYVIGFWRVIRLRLAPLELRGKLDYMVVLDRLAGSGLRRLSGESREEYAQRLQERAPGINELTAAHLRWALGHPERREVRAQEVTICARAVRRAYAHQSRGRWLLGVLNPYAWLMIR